MDRLDDGLMSNGLIAGPISTTSNNDSNSSSSSNNSSSQQQQQQQSNINLNKEAKYTMPGVLHYLQHEWSKYEYDKQQWELEKAELLTKISFLQGERRAQETLKNDLLRRIKMLELALKQERVKYNKLKASIEQPLIQNKEQNQLINEIHNSLDETSNTSLSLTNLLNQHQASNASNSNQLRQGRQLLRQYLQEISYTDTIIDIRSNRLRSLFGISIKNDEFDNKDANLNDKNDIRRTNDDDSSNLTAILLKNSKRQQKQFQINGQQTSKSQTEQKQQQQENENDLDSDEVLKEFAFLNNENETSSSESESCGSSTNGDDWNIDRDTLTRLTEQYKKERKSKSSKANSQQQSLANTNHPQQQQQLQVSYSSVRPSRSSLQAMIANLNEVSANDSLNHETKNDDETLDSSLNLGELSRISVNDETVIETNNNNNKTDLNLSLNSSTRHTLVNKYSLKGHFDSIRCVTFHPIDSLVLSGSEDQTIKLWNLDKFASFNTQSSKKNAQNSDYEPIYTYRGHSAAILDLLMCSNGTQFFSCSLDSTIKLWNMPSSCDQIDPYDVYNSNIYVKSLIGHTDAVWSMCLNGDTLVSSSSDRSISIWKPFNDVEDTRLSTIQLDYIPTSINFNSLNSQQIIAAFDRHNHQIFDIESGKSIFDFEGIDNQDNSVSHCYKILSHPTNSLIISAHEDKSIRFYDSLSGKLIHKMIAHQDACTNLAIDPSHTYLLSSSHDCSIRLWSLDTKNCIQEITAHRKKNDESVHCVAYHETKSYIASGAADALLKIYV